MKPMTSLDLTASDQRLIVILCRHFGGFGGEENYVMCMLDALHKFNTAVFVTKTIKGFGLTPQARPNLQVHEYSPWRFIRFLFKNANRIDIFFAFSGDWFPGESYIFKILDQLRIVKILNPAGNRVQRVASHYDYLAWEADNAADYGSGNDPRNCVVLPPALHPRNMPADFPRLSAEHPFYLTVFNNYDGEIKGFDLMIEAAKRSRYSIVWCTSNSNHPEGLPHNIKPVAASRELISALMKACRAYVCFSKTEGFGWSVLEAFIHGRPVITRNIGVARAYIDQVLNYENLDELLSHLNDDTFPAEVQYDLKPFSQEAFVNALNVMLANKHRET